MALATTLWPGIAALLWLIAAAACGVVAMWLWRLVERFGRACTALALALAVTGIWALSSGLLGPASTVTALTEAGRNLGWLFALYRLFAVDGRLDSVQPVRPMLFALGFVELVQGFAHALFDAASAAETSLAAYAFQTVTLLHLLLQIGGLVLVHNLYVGARAETRLLLRWPAAALLVLWGFDLNYYTVAYLTYGTPEVLAALRSVAVLVTALLLAIGALTGRKEASLRPSRAVTFQSLSLMLIGGYLVSMVAVAQWLSWSGGNLTASLQLGVLAAATVLGVAVLASARMRGWMQVMLTKHLFQHRYDYRTEWLRFTRTIAKAGSAGTTLNERIIRALADITDSPAGLLLTPGEGGQLELAARWQWPTAEVPAVALSQGPCRFFEQGGYVADLDELRGGRASAEAAAAVPQWLLDDPRAWALVPLLHFEQLVGMIVLARPPHARKLDWEDFDLLRIAGQQLASYLAEHAGQSALAEAGRFDDFNRRIAFVMHDIKNLASQLSLLARNAEQHSDNPEFQRDMLITLRNSSDKLHTLLSRLSRYGSSAIETLSPVAADEVAARVAAQFQSLHHVQLVEAAPCRVAGQADSLEQVLVHLVQNAIDASPDGAPVFLRVACEGLSGVIEVLDSGTGMSAEFVRSRLFKPFDSSKPGGFGIGAYEARELVRAMRGRLEVESREGLGSRFTIHLPLFDAVELIDTLAAKRVA
ncbi:XrtA/PEP-CTERM system histidine kinase PrsK [Novosphingobium sp.]|uniref:XrtA/PEP-CTERM system histidine kinase PrsK n=1 Tax=Novosphingobium sp. TaxID=1874826 RepID=UPI002733685C|nr:XrtA/PEP-CTERM system histidine kinase PrsK [Novosphingobium sp.]MDP3907162.1 PEP-CTERM system histidine kinase PrsK [Novosphingobium sp.]